MQKNFIELVTRLQEFTAVENDDILKSIFDEIQNLQLLAEYQNINSESLIKSIVEFDENNENENVSIDSTNTASINTMQFSSRVSFIVFENTSEFLSHKRFYEIILSKFILAFDL